MGARESRVWTEEELEDLVRRRIKGHPDYLTWDALAVHFKCGRNTVLEKGRRLSARIKAANIAKSTNTEVVNSEITHSESRSDYEEALPSGHPISWNLINAGLRVLENLPYPYPVYSKLKRG